MEKGRVKKGKRARITQEAKNIIMAHVLDHPRIPRTELAKRLQNELEAKGFDVPEVEVLERKISWFRNHVPRDREDDPWHVLTLADYNMPAEALPALLLVWGKTQQWPDKPLTIREARWVARLYRVITNIEFLYIYAHHYALQEKVAKISGALPASNIFWSDANMTSPAMESLLFLIPGPVSLPDLEMIAASIYERPPKGAGEAVEEALERLRLEIAVVARKAGLSKIILDELIESVKEEISKEAQDERSHTSKG